MKIQSLLLTIIVGIFFLIGMIIPNFFKDKNKLILSTTGFTFVIMLFLIFFDLIPEINDILKSSLNYKYLVLVVLFIFLGIALLKLLDIFIPEHIHKHHDNEANIKEHNNHLYHIGLITAISLIIHNILEGISIYITGINDFKLGLLLSLSVGCHNLPLGIEISANMNIDNNNKSFKLIISFFLIISSFLGAFLLFILNNNIHVIIETILLAITLGMLIYITFLEIYPEIKENITKKELKLGLLIGLILATILFVL
jgi:ZIP family zinc transporter